MNRRLTPALAGAMTISTITLAITLRAQGPAPMFRGGVDVVHVDVSVLDKDRKPVRGLTAADFTVLEDGQPREIVTFGAVELPPKPDALHAGATWVADIAPDITTNALSPDGRLVVIAFDWSIRLADQPAARRIARATVEAMGPNDLGAVIFTSNFANAGTPQNFTGNKSLLLNAINRPIAPAFTGRLASEASPTDFSMTKTAPIQVRGRAPRSTTGGTDFAELEAKARELPDPSPELLDRNGEQSADCFCRLCTYEKVGDVADTVAGVVGRRKSLVFIGTYFVPPSGTKPVDPQGYSEDQQKAQRDYVCELPVKKARDILLRKLSLANLTVHVMDPAGTASGDGPVPDALEGFRQVNVPFLAGMTGGRALMNSNAPEAALPAIFEESAAYYVLAFPAAARAKARDGINHIEVKVSRPGVSVQARAGYEPAANAAAAKAEEKRSPLAYAVDAPLPRTELPLSLSAVPTAPAAGKNGAIAVTLRVQPAAEALPSALSRPEHVSVVVAALDAQGHVAASRTQAVDFAATSRGVYEVLSRLDVKPGRYEVRAAVDVASGPRGSVYGFVEVPDFAQADLALSGISLHVSPQGLSGPTGALGDLLPAVPTARREFVPTETVAGFLRIYRNGGTPTPTVEGRIVDASGRVILDDKREAMVPDYAVVIPMNQLPAGAYLLHIQVTAGTLAAARSVRFTVKTSPPAPSSLQAPSSRQP